jgi:hypothetical protein
MKDERFKPCPGCSKMILLDAASCRCGWKAGARAEELDSAGRPKHCRCGALASVIDAGGVPRCSSCDAQARFGATSTDGPGYAAFKAKLAELGRGRGGQEGAGRGGATQGGDV